MGDRRPSQFLRHLQALANTAIPEQLLRTLWIGRLPSQLQAILATRSADNLEEVADQADRIYEVTHRAVASIQATSETNSSIEKQIKELSKQVASLNTRFSRSYEKNKKRFRSRSRSKKREQEDICFFHQRFKEKAKKCVQPCNFKKKEENQ